MDVNRQSSSYKRVANIPFINFTREFSKDQYGEDVLDFLIRAGKAWNRLTDAQKKRYRKRCSMNDDDAGPSQPPSRSDIQSSASGELQPSSSASDACCPKKRRARPKARCPPPKRRKPKCAPKPRCPKPRRKPRCAAKPRCPRPRKPRCAPKPKCPRKPKCAPKRKSCQKPRCQPKRKTACKLKCNPGPVTNNGYLNYLRDYRRAHCSMKPKELVMKAARAWCRLPECKKYRYHRQACKVTTSPRHKRRRVCTTRP